jgi:hypothetical protein
MALVAFAAWLFSLGLLAWVYEGEATGYTVYACAGASPELRPPQCATNTALDTDAFVIWAVSWLVLAICVKLSITSCPEQHARQIPKGLLDIRTAVLAHILPLADRLTVLCNDNERD